MTATITLHKTATKGEYEARVDGRRVGIVYKDRTTSMHGYADNRMGYRTERSTWSWDLDGDNLGGYEFNTRAEAVADMADFVS